MVKKKRKNNSSGNGSNDDIYDAEHIVSHKYDDQGKLFYRVKWKGWSSAFDTFEVRLPNDDLTSLL